MISPATRKAKDPGNRPPWDQRQFVRPHRTLTVVRGDVGNRAVKVGADDRAVRLPPELRSGWRRRGYVIPPFLSVDLEPIASHLRLPWSPVSSCRWIGTAQVSTAIATDLRPSDMTEPGATLRGWPTTTRWTQSYPGSRLRSARGIGPRMRGSRNRRSHRACGRWRRVSGSSCVWRSSSWARSP